MYQDVEFEVLKGKTLVAIEYDDTKMIFTTTEGEQFRLYHYRGCCEDVYLEDICGDLEDLLHTPILVAELVCHENEIPEVVKDKAHCYTDESFTWSFYKLDTIKGGVTIRWFGESSGWYSETVDFEKIN